MEDSSDYDSDRDPSYIPSHARDVDLDYDEYSDGEVPEQEIEELNKAWISSKLFNSICFHLSLFLGSQDRVQQGRGPQAARGERGQGEGGGRQGGRRG